MPKKLLITSNLVKTLYDPDIQSASVYVTSFSVKNTKQQNEIK